jgi:hypothetical protein
MKKIVGQPLRRVYGLGFLDFMTGNRYHPAIDSSQISVDPGYICVYRWGD